MASMLQKLEHLLPLGSKYVNNVTAGPEVCKQDLLWAVWSPRFLFNDSILLHQKVAFQAL